MMFVIIDTIALCLLRACRVRMVLTVCVAIVACAVLFVIVVVSGKGLLVGESGSQPGSKARVSYGCFSQYWRDGRAVRNYNKKVRAR